MQFNNIEPRTREERVRLSFNNTGSLERQRDGRSNEAEGKNRGIP